MSKPLKLAGGIARRFQAAAGFWLSTPIPTWLSLARFVNLGRSFVMLKRAVSSPRF
jgi:hypothetical protein